MAKTVAELEKELKDALDKANALTVSNQRIVDESKQFKDRAQKAEQSIEDNDKQKLEDDGKINELLIKERETNKKLLSDLTDTRSSVLKEKLRSEIGKHAKDALDIDLLLKVPEHQDLLKIDGEKLTIDGVQEFVKATRESKPFLFGKQEIDNGDNAPPNGKDDLQTDDQKYFAELKTVNSDKELQELRKKYNK